MSDILDIWKFEENGVEYIKMTKKSFDEILSMVVLATRENTKREVSRESNESI